MCNYDTVSFNPPNVNYTFLKFYQYDYLKNLLLPVEILIPFSAVIAIGDFMVISEEDIS